MQRQYVDAFFATGELLLSSFAQFGYDLDPERGDLAEGLALHYHESGPFWQEFLVARLPNALILCTSARRSADLMTLFNVDSLFRIDDPEGFARAIGDAVPSTCRVHGPCTYVDRPEDRFLSQHPAGVNFGMKAIGTELRFQTPSRDTPPCPDQFRKGLRHAHQEEIRFVFLFDRNVPRRVKVSVPAARAFCTRPDDIR
jgi:hypothetical protein